jgi:hypothetical protein
MKMLPFDDIYNLDSEYLCSIYICINNVFDFSRGLSKLWRRRVEEEELEEATTFTRTIDR